jgi:hypothetical protein
MHHLVKMVCFDLRCEVPFRHADRIWVTTMQLGWFCIRLPEKPEEGAPLVLLASVPSTIATEV